MPVYSIEFSNQQDVTPVDPFGFIDLAACYLNNSIPSDLSITEVSYNGVEDPDSLLPHPSDVFESYRQAESVVKSNAAAQSAASTLGEQ